MRSRVNSPGETDDMSQNMDIKVDRLRIRHSMLKVGEMRPESSV